VIVKERAIPYRWVVAVTLLIVTIPDAAASDGGKDYSRGWIFIGACVVLGIVAASFIRTREKPVASSVEASRA
jgi:hypothetical protein